MSAAHTPGPWAVHPALAQVDAFGPSPQTVCRLLWPTDVRGEAETAANARLIAAAPDLLAALTGLLREIADWPQIHQGGDYLHGGALIPARAAIAKAGA